eukprot:tig00020610_g11966.t1
MEEDTRAIVLDEKCYKQFDDPDYVGTKIEWDKHDFERRVNAFYQEAKRHYGVLPSLLTDQGVEPPLVNGRYSWSKHLFVSNFTTSRAGSMEITPHNRHLLESGYKRRENGLSFLCRWFPEDKVHAPVAAFLDVVLHHRDKVNEERAGRGLPSVTEPARWRIVDVKAQEHPYEEPMQPYTLLRFALGSRDGGGSVPLDYDEYEKCVEYWEEHAVVGHHAHDPLHQNQICQIPSR